MVRSRTFVSDLRIVARSRHFRRLLATRLSSQFTDGAFQVGLASLFFFSPERAATAGGVAAAFSVAVLPYTVVGPFAGSLLDRWRRRNVLVVANLVRAVLVVAVALTLLTTGVGPPLYVLVLLCLSINRFFLAGLGASLPHVVDEDELVMANAVSPTCGTLAAMLGGGTGYLVRLALGPGTGTDATILLLAAVAYLAASQVARTMAPDLLGPDGLDAPGAPHGVLADARRVATDLAAAARHVWARRPVFAALAAIGAHRFAYGVTTLQTVLLCRNYFADPADVDRGLFLLAAAFGVSGAGFAVAAAVTPAATRWLPPARWISCCYVAAALVELMLLARLTVPWALTAAFFLGTAAQSSKICVDAIVQAGVDDAFRGRVFSFYDVVFNLAFVAAAVAGALTLPTDGFSRAAFGVVCLIYLATAAAYHLATRVPGPAPHAGTVPPEPVEG